MKMTSAIAGALALAFSMGSAQATEFVVNGNFTQLSNGLGQFDTNTTVTGWSGNGGYNFVFNTADQSVQGIYGGLALWDAANGGANSWNGTTLSGAGNFAALDGDFQTSAISQTITGLTPGKQYYLSFNYAFSQQYGFDGDTLQNLTVSFGSTLNATSPTFSLSSHGFSGWLSAGGYVTADSTSDVLSFLAYGNLPVPPFALVSDVSLTGAIPEISTWAMMLAGFAGLGFVGYRRRAKNSAVA
jgi:hypothetical protein